MQLYKYRVINDENLISYVQGFTSTQVIWQDYMYVPTRSLFGQGDLYDDKQFARLMCLTDGEYAQLVDKFLGHSQNNVHDDLDLQSKRHKLAMLEQKAKYSRYHINNQLSHISRELADLEKYLHPYLGLLEKEKHILNAYSRYRHLSRFNLQKIYEDLVSINSKISALESQYLELKAKSIKQNIVKFESDKGKIALGIGTLIGMGLFGSVFYILRSSVWIYMAIWSIGIVLGLLFILFSQHKVEEVNFDLRKINPDSVLREIEMLQARRNQILNLLNLHSADEFFFIKAQLAGIQKELDYIRAQKELLAQQFDAQKLLYRKNELDKRKNEILMLQYKANDITTKEMYEELQKEMRTLRLALSAHVHIQTKENILQRLKEIRNELKMNMSGFTRMLQDLLVNYINEINSKIIEISTLGIINPFNIDQNFSSWDQLSLSQRVLLYYLLSKRLYTGVLFLIFEYFLASNDDPERIYVEKLINYFNNDSDLNLVMLEI
ncbi:MAG: hypothetical protein KatS3mg084_0579 [Candidatus Dojkabacteria bacterium]|nr:MAG: hypothetical protein KatS3mg084_0579 [Candidatus Dojkabacteria bacterium]